MGASRATGEEVIDSERVAVGPGALEGGINRRDEGEVQESSDGPRHVIRRQFILENIATGAPEGRAVSNKVDEGLIRSVTEAAQSIIP